MYAAQTPSSLWDNIFIWGQLGGLIMEIKASAPYPKLLFVPLPGKGWHYSNLAHLWLWHFAILGLIFHCGDSGPFFFNIRWAHLKRHGEVSYSLPSRERLCHNEQLFLGSIIWWVLSTAPSSLQLPSKKMSRSVQIRINPFSPLRDCVLWLPGQKAGSIFTYHFDAILGCNWNWVLGVEILTQSTKGWRELRGCTQEGLFPEASWLGDSGFLEPCYGQQVGVPLQNKPDFQ